MRGFFHRCRAALLDVLSPPGCAACDAPRPPGALFCTGCEEPHMPPVEALPGGVPLVAAFSYGGNVARAITRFKYGSRPDLAEPFAAALAAAIRRATVGTALVIPVPLHPRKLAHRGYNQAALLGGLVAEHLGWCISARALVRTRDTLEQASLSRKERLTNVASVFAARRPVGAAHVLIVDDVVTTGATALACMRAAVGAGALQVTIAAVARAGFASAAEGGEHGEHAEGKQE